MGFDPNWVDTGSDNRRATYTDLSPGRYQFQFEAANHQGVWNRQGRAIDLNVLPAPWRTTAAYMLYASVTLGLLLALFRLRTRVLLKRARLLEHKVAERTATINDLMEQRQRLFTNISHEFKTPLTLILSPLGALLDQPQAKPFADKLKVMQRKW